MSEPVVFFSVPGDPRGKGRGTPVQRGRHLAIITGAETEAYQNKVATFARGAMRQMDLAAPLQGPLELRMLIRFRIPRSASTPKRAAMLKGQIKPTRKPDADNVVKAVKDGCNGVVWHDDVQITGLWVRKVYATTPGVDVSVRADAFVPT